MGAAIHKAVNRIVHPVQAAFDSSPLNPNSPLDASIPYNTRQLIGVEGIVVHCLYWLLMLAATIGIGMVLVSGDGYHMDKEQAEGVAFVQIQDTGVPAEPLDGAEKKVFASDDIVEPGVKSGDFFVTTRLDILREKRGLCADPRRPCKAASDCGGPGGTCSGDNVCEERGWCPENSEKPATYLVNSSDIEFWVKSAVQFVRLDPDNLFATSMSTPSLGSNVVSLRALLQKCSPPVNFEDVRDEGALVDVVFFWNCTLAWTSASPCTPEVVVRRLDPVLRQASVSRQSVLYDGADTDKRERRDAQGFRLDFRTVGLARRFSPMGLLLELSLALVLLGFVRKFVDRLLFSKIAEVCGWGSKVLSKVRVKMAVPPARGAQGSENEED